MKAFLTSFLLLAMMAASAQQELLQSGPMIAYTGMREAAIWVQTRLEAEVYIRYSADGDDGQALQTALQVTHPDQAFTATFVLQHLEPGREYTYTLFLNGEAVAFDYPTTFATQPLWQYRTEPPTVRFALGSCFYINETAYDRPGKPYGDKYSIMEHLHAQRPDFMLWLGDNTYMREVDWESRSGLLHRHTHTRSTPELQALLASTPQYAILDDHDFGPNDADRSYPYAAHAREAFKLFWPAVAYGVDGEDDLSTAFAFGDAHFFLLDNRSHRTNYQLATTNRQMLGQGQIDWLIEALKYSRAPFKFVAVGGQVLNEAPVYENYAQYAEERQQLIDRIDREGIQGVVFLTGDRHHTAINSLETASGIQLLDFTVSPLTSRPYTPKEENRNLMKGTVVDERNFGIITISGKRKERVLQLAIYNAEGEHQWTRRFNESLELLD